jgi:putative metallohydrolase (TIGR04338 family)
VSRPRDSQKSKLYAAERQVPGFHTEDRIETVPEIEAFVATVLRSPWLVRTFGRFRIRVHDGRRHRIACAYPPSFAYGHATIVMPRWARSKMIALHEIAHVMTPAVYAWHGREYAALYLQLVRHFLGAQKFRQLRTAFIACRVKYKPKSKRRGNPEALRRWREAKAAAAAASG